MSRCCETVIRPTVYIRVLYSPEGLRWRRDGMSDAMALVRYLLSRLAYYPAMQRRAPREGSSSAVLEALQDPSFFLF